MKPKIKKTEAYRSTSKLEKDMGCHRKTIYRLSVKNRFRFFKFNGVRCLEVNDAICLCDILLKENRITQEAYDHTYKLLEGLL